MIQALQIFADEQAGLREEGEANAITEALATMDIDGMRSDDFMFYFADIFVESVQYGNRSNLCDFLKDNEDLSLEDQFY